MNHRNLDIVYPSKIKTDALTGNLNIFTCLWIMDIDNRFGEKDSDNCDEMLLQVAQHLIQRSHHKCWGREQITKAEGPHEDLSTTVKKRKLKWCGHFTRSTGLTKSTPQETVQGKREEDGEGDGRITSPNGQERLWVTTWGGQKVERDGMILLLIQ